MGLPIGQWLGVLAAGAMLTAVSAVGAAQFPTKPITIVVPYTAGGTADMLARMAGEALQQSLGQPVVIESRPGAGGSIGTTHVARSKPDGYTLIFTASGSMAINPYVYKLNYDTLKDLDQLTILVDLPFVLVTSVNKPDFNMTSLRQLVDYARSRPGEVSFANAGIGTQQHLTQMMFMKATQTDLQIVPYKGSMPAVNDLLGGHLHAMLDNTGVQTPFIQSGKVRPLMVTSKQRVSVLPDVPTADEAGLPGFESVAWFGLAAPAGTPADILTRMHQILVQSFARPEVKEKLEGLGMVPVVSTPADTTSRVKDNLEAFGAVARDINLQPN